MKDVTSWSSVGTHYRLVCVRCQKPFEDRDQGFLLNCDEKHDASLLRTVYLQKQFTVEKDQSSLFRYSNWLPVRRTWKTTSLPAVFHDGRLAARLRLANLIVAFSGYWPERGAFMETCSFKELEANSVCARLPQGSCRRLVVASAGNTGRAFLQAGSEQGIPLLVVVPEYALPEMWLTVDKNPCVELAVLKGQRDYLDAIELANAISCREGYCPEGGVRNVARRDGLGTVVLRAVELFGRIPDHYFQAIGSGTGAIGVWEMNLRLVEDARFQKRKMKLHLVQNEPFAGMAEAWLSRRRELPSVEVGNARDCIARLHARVLGNRMPAYGVAGGVFDALADSDGAMYSVTNEEARSAGHLFENIESCDLDPAAEVALAGLLKAIEMGRIGRKDIVLLNLTGGGRKKVADEEKMRRIKPDLVF